MLITFLILSLVVTGGLGREVRSCTAGWALYEPEDVCLQFFSTSPFLQYTQALAFCGGMSAEMMMIKTQEKDDFVNERVTGISIWNGFNDLDLDGLWTFQDGDDLGGYSNWITAPIDDVSGNRCTVRTPDRRWKIVACSDTQKFFCQKPATITHIECENRWHLIPDVDACIKPIKGMRNTFQEAESRCMELGGDLAISVVSRAQRRHVMSFIGFRGHFWIGVSSPDENGQFEFLDGLPLSDNSPFKRKGTNGHCVSMKMGRWYTKRCNRRQFFICQKPPIYLP